MPHHQAKNQSSKSRHHESRSTHRAQRRSSSDSRSRSRSPEKEKPRNTQNKASRHSKKSRSRSKSKGRTNKRKDHNRDSPNHKKKATSPLKTPKETDTEEKERKMKERLERVRALKSLEDKTRADAQESKTIFIQPQPKKNNEAIQPPPPIPAPQPNSSRMIEESNLLKASQKEEPNGLTKTKEEPQNTLFKDELEIEEDSSSSLNSSVLYPQNRSSVSHCSATTMDQEDAELDPLDAYLAQISGEAVQQQTQPVQSPLEAKKAEESKVITLEEIMRGNGASMEIETENETEEEGFNELIKTLKEQDVVNALKKQDVTYSKEAGFQNKPSTLMEEEAKGTGEILSDDEDGAATDNYFVNYDENSEIGGKGKVMAARKELKPVDHGSVKYKPFKKNIYVECKELQEMKEQEVEKLRKQLGDIKVRGLNPPKPIFNWYQCGLTDSVLDLIKYKKKFPNPFPIQCQVHLTFLLLFIGGSLILVEIGFTCSDVRTRCHWHRGNRQRENSRVCSADAPAHQRPTTTP